VVIVESSAVGYRAAIATAITATRVKGRPPIRKGNKPGAEVGTFR